MPFRTDISVIEFVQKSHGPRGKNRKKKESALLPGKRVEPLHRLPPKGWVSGYLKNRDKENRAVYLI